MLIGRTSWKELLGRAMLCVFQLNGSIELQSNGTLAVK